MRPSRTLTSALAAAATIALLAGCSASASPTSSGSGEPEEGGDLRFGLLAGPTAPDVQLGGTFSDGIVGGNTADKLTYFNPETKEIEPWLAQSWTVSDDLTQYSFTIRDGVTFSDGTALTAETVKANYDLLGLGAPDLGIAANTELFSGYVGSEVTDGDVVTLRFDAPRASILRATAHFNAGILAPSTLTKTADERADFTNVIGSGPFVITAFDPQGTTVLEKRDDYDWAPAGLDHGGAAYLDEVELIAIPEATARTGALRAGELDAILDVQTTDERALAAENYTISSALVPGKSNSWDINAAVAPTNDIAVRKALQLGWDRDSLFQSVLSDSYAPATSIASEALAGFTDLSGSSLRYDPDEAERLLDDAGWQLGDDGIRVKDGERLTVKVNALNLVVVNKPAFELVQQDLREIGIDLELHVVPGSEWVANRKDSDSWNVIAYTQTAGDISVLDEVFSPLRTNISQVAEGDDAYAPLVEVLSALESTPEGEQRDELADRAQELIVDEYALSAPIFNLAQVAAAAPGVHGVSFDAFARANFYTTWLDNTD